MKYKTNIRSSRGFSVIEALIILIVIGGLIAAGLFVGKKKDQGTSGNGQQNQRQSGKKDDGPLVIHNFGLKSLDSVDVTTKATRDFTASGHKGFYIFGDILPGTPVRHNPNFEFASMKEGTQIISAIDGVVGFVKQQSESSDFEVFLMPSENSDWIIGYDHLTDLKVKKGDTVKVGDVLGVPARQNNGLLRFEFQINKNKNGQDGMHICPSTLLASDVREKTLNDLQNMQDSWETVSGLELYNPAAQKPIGCTQTEMTPAFANGQ